MSDWLSVLDTGISDAWNSTSDWFSDGYNEVSSYFGGTATGADGLPVLSDGDYRDVPASSGDVDGAAPEMNTYEVGSNPGYDHNLPDADGWGPVTAQGTSGQSGAGGLLKAAGGLAAKGLKALASGSGSGATGGPAARSSSPSAASRSSRGPNETKALRHRAPLQQAQSVSVSTDPMSQWAALFTKRNSVFREKGD